MSDTELVVRPAVPGDEAGWRRLWADYLAFYDKDLPEDLTADTWRRLVGGQDGFSVDVAERGGTLVGFVHAVPQPGTWSRRPKLYLEDLYVDPTARGAGVGARLIAAVVERARRLGADEVHWITDTDNAVAQRLYDRVATRSAYVRYEIDLR